MVGVRGRKMTDTARVTTYMQAMGGPSFERGEDVVELTDGGIAVVGYSTSFGNGSDDILVMKLDANGELLWAKMLEGWGSEKGFGIVETTDGGIALTGSSTGFSTVGEADVLVAKVDADGSLLWARTIGGVSAEQCYRIAEATDGSLLLVGESESFGAGGTDALVVKLDLQGELLWFRTFGGTGDDYARAVAVAPDGSVAVIGFTNSNRSSSAYDVLVFALDADGDVLWSETIYAEATSQTWWDIEPTADDGWACIGFTTAFGSGDADILTFRLGNDGQLLQAITVGGAATDYGYGIVETSDAELVLVGYSHSFGDDNSTRADAFLAKLHANGTLAWARLVGANGTEDTDPIEEAFAVVAASTGTLLLVGHTQSVGIGSDSVLLAQFTSDGNISNCSYAFPIDPEVSDITSNVSSQAASWMLASGHSPHTSSVTFPPASVIGLVETEVACAALYDVQDAAINTTAAAEKVLTTNISTTVEAVAADEVYAWVGWSALAVALAASVVAAVFCGFKRCQAKATKQRPRKRPVTRISAKYRRPSFEDIFGSLDSILLPAGVVEISNDTKIVDQGGSGRVYVADILSPVAFQERELPVGSMVALKELFSMMMGNAEELAKEVRLLSRVCHPNIVPFLGILRRGTDSNASSLRYFMVFTFAANGNLACHLSDRTILFDMRKTWSAQIASALEYIHHCGIIHRDLKPDNVLLTEDFVCQVTDFGLARTLSAPGSITTNVGTVAYMAPEMLHGTTSSAKISRETAPAVDTYSLGVLIAAIFNFEQPFKGMATGSIVGGVVLGSLRPALPVVLTSEACDLLKSMWHADPERRPPISGLSAVLNTVLARASREPTSGTSEALQERVDDNN